MQQPQERILKKIVDILGGRAQAVEVLSKLLDKGPDSIYRRLNGESVLTVEELRIIAEALELSIDHLLFGENDQYVFRFNASNNQIQTAEDYLRDIGANLEVLLQRENPHVYYASEDVPLFMYLFYPKLLVFKFYIYGRTTWNFSYWKDRKFSFDLISDDFFRLANSIARDYSAIYSTDLWRLNIMDTTLSQLNFIQQMGFFENQDDAIVVCDELLKLINHMQRMTELGRKFPPDQEKFSQSGKFELFFNEFSATNTTILANANNQRMLYVTMRHPNFLYTADPTLCLKIETWLKALINNSTCISTFGAHKRMWYFNRLTQKVNKMKDRLIALRDR